MENMNEIRRQCGFTSRDEENLKELASIRLPLSNDLAEDFYDFLLENSYSAAFFRTEEGVRRWKETIASWLKDLLAGPYSNLYLTKLERIGRVHVRIGLKATTLTER